MDAYKEIFLSESGEFIQAMSDGLLELEKDATDLEPVETVFRGAHSLKGMAAAMGYDRTSDLTHKMESLLDRVRQRELPADSPLIDLMLEATDLVKEVIADESSGSSDVDTSEMAERIASWSGGGPAKAAESAGDKPDDEELVHAPVPTAATGHGFRATVTLEENCVLKAVRAYMVIKRLSHMGTVIDTVPTGREIEDEEFEHEFAVILSTEATAEDVEEAVLAVSEVDSVSIAEEELPEAEVEQEVGDDATRAVRKTSIPKLSETQTVRISIGHLDTMVDLVGELVILRARLGAIAHAAESRVLEDAVEELHRVAGELQHEVMLTRMVPVGNIFNRFPRMVRDLARDLGKEVEFEMDGLDIELDRTVLDEIGDPIVHLLRNSVDHGIEQAEERAAAGKSETGLVRLTACRDRDNVRIEVSDDGRGIDCERVWGKATATGLADAEERDTYTDEQILMFTCVPGFSTTTEATKVSGRGVGMDVVKGKIEYLGGSLSIKSVPGKGAEFTLTLPAAHPSTSMTISEPRTENPSA
jgi:two-component system chemotaxis sensor kinase CheA